MNLNEFLLWLPRLLAAGALSAGGYLTLSLLLSRRRYASRILAAFGAQERPAPLAAKMGSQVFKVRLAFRAYGLEVAGRETLALWTVYGVGMGLLLLGMMLGQVPKILWLAAPFLSYFLCNGIIASRWSQYRQALEQELPTFLLRLSSYLQANPNLIQALDEVAQGLDPSKPLQSWMRSLADDLQKGGVSALQSREQEAGAVSPTLLLAVVEIGRVWQTGGQGYLHALKMAAENMATLLETRAQAQAVAAGAWGTARTILIALSITLGATLLNPVSRPAMQTPLIQGALLFALLWAGLGFGQIKDLVDSLVE